MIYQKIEVGDTVTLAPFEDVLALETFFYGRVPVERLNTVLNHNTHRRFQNQAGTVMGEVSSNLFSVKFEKECPIVFPYYALEKK